MNYCRKKIRASLIVVMLFFAVSTQAQVRISEIAWQGYLGDANNEWIEIYNEGSASVNLDGWLLEAEDGTPSINLSGLSISSNSFLLLERTDDDSVPGIAGDVFYTGALANTGELLRLKNADGTVQHSASFTSGWPEVSDSSQTLSFLNNSWVVSVATPKSANEASAENENEDDEEDDDGESNSSNDSDEDSNSASSSSKQKEEVHYDKRKVTIESPGHAYVGVPLIFGSVGRDHDGGKLRKGIYIWNMGDGNVLYKNSSEEFSYTYNHPGEYVVVLYYNNVSFGKDLEELDPEAQDQHVLNVLEHAISIENVLPNGTLSLTNNSAYTVDLDGWRLTNGDVDFILPRRTLVRAGKTITLPSSNTGITHNPISIFNPTGQLVDFGSVKKAPKMSVSQVESNGSTSTENQIELLSEDEIQEIELSFDSLQNEASANSSNANSNTLTVILFLVMVGFAGFIVWYLIADKKTNLVVEGYEVVEE